MNRSFVSFVGIAAAAGFLLACSGADVDTLPIPGDSVKIAKNALESLASTSGEWVPTKGQTWNYNLLAPVDTDADVDVFMIDMDNDDSQDTIDLLHSKGKWVVCYISIGTAEDWRDDFGDFPASALGFEMVDWKGEYWLDVSKRAVRRVMNARLKQAQRMGCDGVEPDNMDVYLQDQDSDVSITGVSITYDKQISYNKWFAKRTHKRGMKVGLKNCVDWLADLADHFDFAINEECSEYEECDEYTEFFLDQGKPVFNVEYTDNLDMCDYSNDLGMDTIIKSYEVTAEFCSCADSTRDIDCDELVP